MMMNWKACLALSLGFLHSGCTGGGGGITIQAGSLEIGITPEGRIGSFVDSSSGRDYLPSGHEAPLLTLRIDGREVLPRSAGLQPPPADFRDADGILVVEFDDRLGARVLIREESTHATLELLEVSGSDQVEIAIWGPFPTTISRVIGETVGVVRGEEFAMGLQALNPRTLGGFPWKENDAMPQLDIFESGDFSDLREEGKRQVLYRVEAAKPDTFGSTLQAYTRNRDRERIIPNWGHERYTAPAFQDGGLTGSKIALFGCPVDEALTTLGAIEETEGLPHPLVDGEWGKTARSATAAYVILPFDEKTIDRAVEVTLDAGLRYLYHPEPFETWGHFQLGPDFPNGVDGLRRAVERAEARGVMVGIHTLSNFITTNDPYVTPIPDPRLARVGTSLLTQDVTGADSEIPIRRPGFFNQYDNNHLRAAVIGEEIIRYRDVSESPPWTLLGVERGAFGSRAAPHLAGDSIGKLADHAYRVFLTNAALGEEMATRLAQLFNQTGLRQISFDGLEGNRSTGMGNYGEVLFTTAWYKALSDEIRSHFIADASRTSHYFWHIYTRMNWGEPWYAGFRESQTEYRLKNQEYFRRNLMPGMLGWFRMQGETSVEDIEWMLARSAAFDAGYAFVTSFEALEENGRSGEILDLIGLWEDARMAGVFSQEQKSRMEDISNEFHLAAGMDGGWDLYQIHPTVVRIENRVRQPGEPSHQTFSVTNPGAPQPLHFILTASGTTADGILLELDGVGRLEIPVRLTDGQAIVYEGGDTATLYSPQWRVLETIPVDEAALIVDQGSHTLLVDASMSREEGYLKVELRFWGAVEPVGR